MVVGRGTTLVCVSVGRGVRGVLVLAGPLCPGPPVGLWPGPRVELERVTVTVGLGRVVVGWGGGQFVDRLVEVFWGSRVLVVEVLGGSRVRVVEGGKLVVRVVEEGSRVGVVGGVGPVVRVVEGGSRVRVVVGGSRVLVVEGGS